MDEMVPRHHDRRHKNQLPHLQLRLRQGMLGGFVITMLLFILMENLIFTNRSDQDAARQQAQAQGRVIAQTLNHKIAQNMQIATSIAAELASSALSYANIDSRMRYDLTNAPTIDGITIAFAPFAYSSSRRLYQTYIFRQTHGTFGDINAWQISL